MNEKVLHTLEYDKIINRLVEKADSAPGKEMCRTLIPSCDLSEIRTAQSETKDALTRLFRKGSTSFGGNHDIGFSLRTLEVGSTLSMTGAFKGSKGFRQCKPHQDLWGKRSGMTHRRTAWIPIFRCLHP